MSASVSDQAREERAYVLGVQAALWGRPLAEYVHTNYAGAKVGAVYLNYFRKFGDLKTAADRYVNTPNNVSIDGYGLGDLSREPLVLSVAAQSSPRWTIVQVGDMLDEVVCNIGGAGGPQPGLYLIAGPDYHGPVPAGMTPVRVPTQLAVIANRVFVNGDADLPAAREAQNGFHLLPLSVFAEHGLRYDPVTDADISRFELTPAAPRSLCGCLRRSG